MADETAINLIFLPGFSTMDKATELSGRGVGMDVVKTNISKLNGYVEVITRKGTGSTFRISIPLTLAIIQALMVRAGGGQFAIPLAPIEETIKIGHSEIENVAGQKVLVVRGKVNPLFELTDILNTCDRNGSDHRYVLVIAIGDRKFCVAVDELLGQEEVVIKTIHGIETESSYILGATITGEGKVVLILDLAGISRNMVGTLKV
jgi:two-component system chemotaxis sensor kinase CheA